MNERYDKLKGLLMELFQLDQPDLDFGIYRILHARKHEIEAFLDKTLPQQVQEALGQYWAAEKETLQKELALAKEQAISLGLDPSQVRKVQELEDRLKETAAQAVSLENEVYDHLYNFFRRYYSEGDFVSKRVYKEGVYAIPYEGEEVKLYWANSDQYYIKTSEYLRDYTFRLRPWSEDQPMRVHFKIVDAAEEEHGNVKPAEGKERVFILTKENFISIENGELVLRFEYRPATLADWLDEAPGKAKPPTQKDLIAIAVKRVFNVNDPALAPWITELQKEHILANNEKAGYSKLEAHLNRYTKRNTFDYFIHKDLGGFLRRELDFYIKSEVMRLDDIEDETAPRVEQYLAKIKVIRRIAGKIIDFLAQIEAFQKKLWLKKKFVVDTQYLIKLGDIPEEFYPEIAANDAQREEWVDLFAIDETKGDLVTPGYTVPLTVEFLKARPSLVVDTRFFSRDFVDRLMDKIFSHESRIDGLLIHGDNFDALQLIKRTLNRKIHVVFADPPYNTGSDGFLYKDSYQHASWLTMMENRLSSLRPLLSDNGLLFLTIDSVEVSRLRMLCDQIFGSENFLADIAWEKRYTRSNNAKLFYSLKDTILCYRSSVAVSMLREPRNEKSRTNYTNPDNDPRGPWISSSYVNPATKAERPNLVYPITNPFTGKTVEHPTHAWKYDLETHKRHVAEGRLYWGPDGKYEYPRLKTFWSEAKDGMVPIDVWHYKETGTTDEGGKTVKALFGGEVFDNPKPPSLIERAVTLSPQFADPLVVMDHFAGSGSTAHAVINLNRADGRRRMFILVEIGDYFDTVLVPRIKKVIYSPEWKGGKPCRLPTPEELVRSPRVVKVLRLESYEDTLNNLELRRTPGQENLLQHLAREQDSTFCEDFVLHYMLDIESRGSLLDIEGFKDPTAYKLKVKSPGSDEIREVSVDLFETFNWLLGLTVHHISAPQTFSAEFERNEEGRLIVKEGSLRPSPNGPWWFRTVEGINPEGQRVLIIWRKLTGDPEKDNVVLDHWFEKQDFSTRDSEFDVIYVNGGHNLGNRLEDGAGLKVRLIEEEFHRLMFETEGV